jgi:DNA-binding MarR family transcriptional regulator
MTSTHCTLITAGSVPRVVEQALDDQSLRPVERLAMWHLSRHYLDFHEYREVKTTALAKHMGIEDQTAGRALRSLVDRGYLDQQRGDRRARAFRMPWTRRAAAKSAA